MTRRGHLGCAPAQFTRFTGANTHLTFSANVNTDAAEAQDGEAISDERLLADRRLEWDSQRLTAAQLASIRAEWQAERTLEQAIPQHSIYLLN